MCGIVAFASVKPTPDAIENALDAYVAQSHRGQKGFGLSLVSPNLHVTICRATSEVALLFRALTLKADGGKFRAALFHHRIPTSTKNTILGTHPFKVSHEQLKYNHIVIHNGMISNDKVLEKEHTEAGFVYQSWDGGVFNDSEAGSIEYAKAVEAEGYALKSLGSQAYASILTNKKTHRAFAITFGTNGQNPIKYTHDPVQKTLALASELSGGDYAKPNTLYTFNLVTGELVSRVLAFPPTPYYSYTSYEEWGGSANGYRRGSCATSYPSHGGVSQTPSANHFLPPSGNPVSPTVAAQPAIVVPKPEIVPPPAVQVPDRSLAQSYDRQIDSALDLVREFRDRLESQDEADLVITKDYTTKIYDLLDSAKEAAQLGFALKEGNHDDCPSTVRNVH